MDKQPVKTCKVLKMVILTEFQQVEFQQVLVGWGKYLFIVTVVFIYDRN